MIPSFSIPPWIEQHAYPGKKMDDLTEAELDELKARLGRFNHETPEISVVIPAWNEENNIYRALSSLAGNTINRAVEIVVINNNSTDRTAQLLDRLGVRNFLEPTQGTPHARQTGLYKARGKYHLCADSDTYYPPRWMELMVKPMEEGKDIVGVYGRYSFMPPAGKTRASLVLYEIVTGILVRIRKFNREFVNVLGFNMGFITEVARSTKGFQVEGVRMFDNARGSDYFVEEAEDGQMAVRLKTRGRLKLVTHPDARVYTSSRRLVAEGGIFSAFKNRMQLHSSRMKEYVTGK